MNVEREAGKESEGDDLLIPGKEEVRKEKIGSQRSPRKRLQPPLSAGAGNTAAGASAAGAGASG